MKKTILAALILVSGLTACYYDHFEEIHPTIPGGTTCVIPDTVSYASNIQPILNASCGTDNNGCHNASNSINLGGNGSLADHAGTVETIADDGINTFMGRIRQTVAQSKWMPKGGGKLDDCSIDKIQKWIDQGQLNN
jgi:hypothetical protein